MRRIISCLLFAFSSFVGAEQTVIRVGFFPNLTHAQAIIGRETGWFEKKMGPAVKIEWYPHAAGPSAMEGIFTKAIDMTYVGPNPAINAYLRAEGKEIRIISGACSGGAAFVIPEKSHIESPNDFKGKRIATPQLGNSQDIAARSWFKSKGLNVTMTGGDVNIIPTGNADIYMLFKSGSLDGAWTIEPWVSRLLLEAQGKIYLEEKSLWTQTKGKYITTQLVSSKSFLDAHGDLVKNWISAHVELTEWINKNPDKAKASFNQGFSKITNKPLSPAILDRAWQNVEFTYDPIQESLYKSADDAFALGFLPTKPDLKDIYDLRWLKEVLKENGH